MAGYVSIETIVPCSACRHFKLANCSSTLKRYQEKTFAFTRNLGDLLDLRA